MMRLSLCAATMIALGSFAFADVQTDYNHKTDFSAIHTYSWGQVKTRNPLYVDRIKDEVNRDLQNRRLHEVPSGGDIVVFARGDVRTQQELQTYYDGLGGGWGRDWQWGGWGGGGFGESTTTTTSQPVGVLVIDMFSGSSKDLVWRGSSSEDLSSNSEKNTKKLEKDIDKMLNDFPPKH